MVSRGGWPFAADSVIGKILHTGVADRSWFVDGKPTTILVQDGTRLLLLAVFLGFGLLVRHAWQRRRHAPATGRATDDQRGVGDAGGDLVGDRLLLRTIFIKVLRTPTLHRDDDHRPEIFAKDA